MTEKKAFTELQTRVRAGMNDVENLKSEFLEPGSVEGFGTMMTSPGQGKGMMNSLKKALMTKNPEL